MLARFIAPVAGAIRIPFAMFARVSADRACMGGWIVAVGSGNIAVFAGVLFIGRFPTVRVRKSALTTTACLTLAFAIRALFTAMLTIAICIVMHTFVPTLVAFAVGIARPDSKDVLIIVLVHVCMTRVGLGYAHAADAANAVFPFVIVLNITVGSSALMLRGAHALPPAGRMAAALTRMYAYNSPIGHRYRFVKVALVAAVVISAFFADAICEFAVFRSGTAITLTSMSSVVVRGAPVMGTNSTPDLLENIASAAGAFAGEFAGFGHFGEVVLVEIFTSIRARVKGADLIFDNKNDHLVVVGHIHAFLGTQGDRCGNICKINIIACFHGVIRIKC